MITSDIRRHIETGFKLKITKLATNLDIKANNR